MNDIPVIGTSPERQPSDTMGDVRKSVEVFVNWKRDHCLGLTPREQSLVVLFSMAESLWYEAEQREAAVVNKPLRDIRAMLGEKTTDRNEYFTRWRRYFTSSFRDCGHWECVEDAEKAVLRNTRSCSVSGYCKRPSEIYLPLCLPFLLSLRHPTFERYDIMPGRAKPFCRHDFGRFQANLGLQVSFTSLESCCQVLILPSLEEYVHKQADGCFKVRQLTVNKTTESTIKAITAEPMKFVFCSSMWSEISQWTARRAMPCQRKDEKRGTTQGSGSDGREGRFDAPRIIPQGSQSPTLNPAGDDPGEWTLPTAPCFSDHMAGAFHAQQNSASSQDRMLDFFTAVETPVADAEPRICPLPPSPSALESIASADQQTLDRHEMPPVGSKRSPLDELLHNVADISNHYTNHPLHCQRSVFDQRWARASDGTQHLELLQQPKREVSRHQESMPKLIPGSESFRSQPTPARGHVKAHAASLSANSNLGVGSSRDLPCREPATDQEDGPLGHLQLRKEPFTASHTESEAFGLSLPSLQGDMRLPGTMRAEPHSPYDGYIQRSEVASAPFPKEATVTELPSQPSQDEELDPDDFINMALVKDHEASLSQINAHAIWWVLRVPEELSSEALMLGAKQKYGGRWRNKPDDGSYFTIVEDHWTIACKVIELLQAKDVIKTGNPHMNVASVCHETGEVIVPGATLLTLLHTSQRLETPLQVKWEMYNEVREGSQEHAATPSQITKHCDVVQWASNSLVLIRGPAKYQTSNAHYLSVLIPVEDRRPQFISS